MQHNPAFAILIQRLDNQAETGDEILHELRTVFDKVATADQVEELKQLILELKQEQPQQEAAKVRIFIS